MSDAIFDPMRSVTDARALRRPLGDNATIALSGPQWLDVSSRRDHGVASMAARVLFALLLSLASSLAWGQAPTVTVDTAASRTYILVAKTGLGHDHAIEGRLLSGEIQLGATERAGQIVFDMRTFDADTDAARKYVGLEGTSDAGTRKSVNENMLGSAVLDVQKFPEATFQIDSCRAHPEPSRNGHPQYVLVGQFSLHGVTRPLQLKCEAVPTQGAIRLRTGFILKQTDYQIKPFSKVLGAVGVANELKVLGELLLRNAGQDTQ